MLQDSSYFPVIQKKCQVLILFDNNINVRRINLALFQILDYSMNIQVLSQLIALSLIILSGPIVIAVLGFIIESFLVWRKMREDYNEEDILALVLVLTISAVIGYQSKILFLVLSTGLI